MTCDVMHDLTFTCDSISRSILGSSISFMRSCCLDNAKYGIIIGFSDSLNTNGLVRGMSKIESDVADIWTKLWRGLCC